MLPILPCTARLKFFAQLFLLFAIGTYGQAQTTHILFDAVKAEMAGNADWVIDADQTNIRFGPGAYVSSSGNQSNPQRMPTPAQSGITGSTPETYWTGALSSWGVDCVNQGYVLETLPWNGQITYGNTSNPQDLSNYQVYIVDEPNILFTSAEKTAIMQFVQNGGGLFMISDHNISDRNSDGWDSPHIWDDFLSNNSVHAYPFGIFFDTVDFSQTTTNISASATDSIIHGPMGTVTKAQWSGGTTMTLDPSANATVKGVVYKTGTTPGNTNAMVAYARYGHGKVAAMGDSSPSDDGTGNPGCTLYNGYWADASGNHRLLLMNITIWLATRDATTAVKSALSGDNHISIYPNPSGGTAQLVADRDLEDAKITVFKPTGQEIASFVLPQWSGNFPQRITLDHGMYIIKVESAQFAQTLRITID